MNRRGTTINLFINFFLAVFVLTPGQERLVAAEQSSKVKVFFRGFGFCGNSNEIASTYPFTASLNVRTEDRTPLMDRLLRDFFQQRREALSKIDLEFNDLAGRRDKALALALGMTEEQVLREDLGDFHKLVVQLGFELLVLNCDSWEVVSSQPIFIEYIDAGSHRFDDLQVKDRVREMISGPESQLFIAIASKCQQIQIGGKNQTKLAVRQVTVGEKALPFLPKYFETHIDAYRQAVAQQFGDLLSSQAHVAMLPYQTNHLTGRLSLVFEDGLREFGIPDPGYSIDLDLRGFKNQLVESKPAEALWAYGAYLGVRIYIHDPNEPASDKTRFHGSSKQGVTKTVPKSQKNVDEFPVVSLALKKAILDAIDQIRKDKGIQDILKLCEL